MDADIVRSTRAYETWLASQPRVVSADLRLKHLRMAESPLEFLRATFYRWLQRWSALPASLVGLILKIDGAGDVRALDDEDETSF